MKPRTFHALGVCLLVATGVVLAADAKDDAVKKDRMKYTGVWEATSLEVDGNEGGDEYAKKIHVINGADGTWVIEVDGQVIARGMSEIDPTKKPKTIDLTETEGADKGQTFHGIYALGDDERKVCIGKAGGQRPDDFTAPADSGRILAVFKRIKK